MHNNTSNNSPATNNVIMFIQFYIVNIICERAFTSTRNRREATNSQQRPHDLSSSKHRPRASFISQQRGIGHCF